MQNSLKKFTCVLPLAMTLFSGPASAESDDSWKFSVSIYGWFPDISGNVALPDGSDGDFTIPVSSILDNLQFTLQGSFDARKGKWGLFTDMIYMDLGKSEKVVNEGNVGGNDWPYELTAKVGFDMKSLILTGAAYYRVIEQPEKSFDILAGLRYTDVEQSLSWKFSGNVNAIPLPGRDGKAKVGADPLDVIVGVRGRFSFGRDNAWFIPYYADIGTGDSDVTWQVFGGIGYAFNWGEVVGAWRVLTYDQPKDKKVADMDFSGPAIGAVFRW